MCTDLILICYYTFHKPNRRRLSHFNVTITSAVQAKWWYNYNTRKTKLWTHYYNTLTGLVPCLIKTKHSKNMTKYDFGYTHTWHSANLNQLTNYNITYLVCSKKSIIHHQQAGTSNPAALAYLCCSSPIWECQILMPQLQTDLPAINTHLYLTQIFLCLKPPDINLWCNAMFSICSLASDVSYTVMKEQRRQHVKLTYYDTWVEFKLLHSSVLRNILFKECKSLHNFQPSEND